MIFTADYSIKMPFGQTLMTALLGILTVMFILAVIDLLIMSVSKAVRSFENKNKDATQQKDIDISIHTNASPLPKNQSQGILDLHGVDESTAAIVMAIVSNQSGIPLNRLCFKSIRLLQEEPK